MVDKVTLAGDRINFAYTLANILEQKAGVRVKWVDETSFGVKICTEKNANISSLGVGKKLVYWSVEVGLDVIQKQLEELRMWIIDGVAVVCHQPYWNLLIEGPKLDHYRGNIISRHLSDFATADRKSYK